MIFMIDGVNQMKIFKHEKSYVMHLITTEEFNLKLMILMLYIMVLLKKLLKEYLYKHGNKHN